LFLDFMAVSALGHFHALGKPRAQKIPRANNSRREKDEKYYFTAWGKFFNGVNFSSHFLTA